MEDTRKGPRVKRLQKFLSKIRLGEQKSKKVQGTKNMCVKKKRFVTEYVYNICL